MVVSPFGLTTRHVTSCGKNYVTLSNSNICMTLSSPNIAKSWQIVTNTL